MPAELLTSKLYMPPLRPHLVPRLRLIRLLQEGLHLKRRMTLVSAPAGFGKTTLVVAWLHELERPAAWLSLDEADNDLARFLAYLGAALQQVDEKFNAPLLSELQSPQAPRPEKVLTSLLNEVALQADPLVLVLDDAHLLTEPSILEAMEFLLHHQPPQLHLVLTTREDPALPLARLRARDQLTEIRARDLRFTQEETGAFLNGVMGLELSSQNVAALEDRTEGWAAGLQMAGLSMQRQADLNAFIADFSGSHRHILDFLSDEVLQRQPEQVRSFLLQTAVLDRLCGPLCDALTGREGSDGILAHLEAANLFVIPLDEERRWYRYHHLFSDLLRSQLARSQPEWIPELHRRACRWYEQHGEIEAAVEHGLQDPDLRQAARLIEEHVLKMLYLGRVATVLGWCDRLPEAVLETSPMLCIGKAWALVLMRRGAHWEEAQRVLQTVRRALDRVEAGEAFRNLMAGHAATIQTYTPHTSALEDKTQKETIRLAQEALRLLPPEEKAIRSVNTLTTGVSYLALGDLDAARRAFQQTLEYGLAGGNYFTAISGQTNLVESALVVGRLKEAMQLCEANIERFNQILAGQSFPPIGALYILKGVILIEENLLGEAEGYLRQGLELVRWMGQYASYVNGYTALARLRAIQGDRPGVLEAVKALEEAWPGGLLYAQALRHKLSTCHWREDLEVRQEAQSWLAQSGVKFAELAVINGMGALRKTYFETNLWSAHVLARLAKETPGAYPLDEAHAYLKSQAEAAASHGFARWVVEASIGRTLLYHAAGKKKEALETLQAALKAAAPTGLKRILLDECDPLRALLAELRPRLADESLILYANGLLEVMSCAPVKPGSGAESLEMLSARELEVLGYLARGLTYEETGRQLFLSLNTVQFHVKNIYGKLLVSKRVQAIEKARALHLI